MFDSNGNSLKRSHIGPLNFYKKDKIFNQTSSPFELIRELKRVGNVRKTELESSELRGKHQLCSTTTKKGQTIYNQASSSPFILVGSPLYKQVKNNQRLLTSSTSKRYQTDVGHSKEKVV